MIIIKMIILFLILLSTSLLGKMLAQKYVYRQKELQEIEGALNILKNKIKFTYEPIPEIFNEISLNVSKNIGNIFRTASKNMEKQIAGISWEKAVDECRNYLKKEDRHALKNLGKMLGQTDVEGQISQIEITEKFIEIQLKKATEERQKNEKLFTKLGTILGLAIIIVLY